MKGEETGVGTLTEKQKEVLRLISQHLQAKEIARLLDITERTVKAHTKAAREKLGVTSSREAARLLAVHDATLGIVPEGQWPTSTVSPSTTDEASFGNGQDFSTERPVSDSGLEGTGIGLADDGITRQVRSDRRYASDSTDDSQYVGPRESDLHSHRGHGLVDRRQAESMRLEALSTPSFLRVLVVKAMWMLLVAAGLVMGILGVLQAVHSVMRYSD